MDRVDPKCCPICGEPNGCAMAAGADDASSCWCATVEIPAAALARCHEEALGRACICRRCATAAPPQAQQ